MGVSIIRALLSGGLYCSHVQFGDRSGMMISWFGGWVGLDDPQTFLRRNGTVHFGSSGFMARVSWVAGSGGKP